MNKKSEKIINQTIKLFIENGIRKTTMDEIAKNANVSKVTIYKYYGDKESFYLEISKSIFVYYTDALDAISNSENELVEKLFNCMDVLIKFTDSGNLKLCHELSMYNESIKVEYSLYVKRYREVLYGLIEQGKNDSIIREDISTDKIFHYIDMGIEYYHNNSIYRNKMQTDEKFRSSFMEFFIKNIFIDTAGLI